MASMPKPSRLPVALEKGDASRGRFARVGERTSIALSELPVDRNASGRFPSAGGSAFRRTGSLHDLGLMLDDNLVDELLLAEGVAVSLPAEMAFRPSGKARGSRAFAGEARPEPVNMEDTLAIEAHHGQEAWVSSRVATGSVRGRDAHEVRPPAFLLEPPLTIRSSDRAKPGIDAVASRALGAPLEAAPGAERAASSMRTSGRGIYAHLAPASIPVADGPFGFAIGEGGSGLGSGSGDSGSDDDPLLQRVVERLRINEGIDRVRGWLWEIQPYLRGLASVVLPGWGQSLNEQPLKARFFRMAAFITLVAADLLLFRARVAMLVSLLVEVDASLITRCLAPIALGGGCLWVMAVYDAVIVARTRRECQSTRTQS